MPRKSPAYRVPRDWIDTSRSKRRNFGVERNLHWLPPATDLETALLAAAQTHHSLARGIRNYRDAEGLGNRDLAQAADISVGAVERILNGSTHLTLEWLYALTAAVNAQANATIRPT